MITEALKKGAAGKNLTYDEAYAWGGESATFYGSGGGGGGYAKSGGSTTDKGIGGAGYQGVVYIRVPA